MRSAISNFWQIEYFVGEFQELKLISRLKTIILPERYLQISVQIVFLEERMLFAM